MEEGSLGSAKNVDHNLADHIGCGADEVGIIAAANPAIAFGRAGQLTRVRFIAHNLIVGGFRALELLTF